MEFTETQQAALTQWVENTPREAVLLFRALDRLYPGLPVDKQVQTWAASRPETYNNFITAVTAKYTATESDVERAVGRATIQRMPDASRAANQGEISELQRQLAGQRAANERLANDAFLARVTNAVEKITPILAFDTTGLPSGLMGVELQTVSERLATVLVTTQKNVAALSASQIRDLYDVARTLDGRVPSVTAFEIAVENRLA